MGRIRQNIQVRGRDYWTRFDTGARNTYVIPEVATHLSTSPTDQPFRTRLGGSVKETHQTAVLQALVDNHPISTLAYVIDEIGRDEDGKPIQILFGALAMQQWSIRPVPDQEILDMTHYPVEFVEF